jgi:hypothetical protein
MVGCCCDHLSPSWRRGRIGHRWYLGRRRGEWRNVRRRSDHSSGRVQASSRVNPGLSPRSDGLSVECGANPASLANTTIGV